jgi:DNA-binding beta-propeller fold protein YncE
MAMLIWCPTSSADTQPPEYRSPECLAVARDKQRLYVSESTAETIAQLDLVNDTVRRRLACGGNPTGLTLSQDGTALYVTVQSDTGQLVVFDTESGKIIRQFAAEHSPIAPVLSQNNAHIYIADRFNNRVIQYDAASGDVMAIIPVRREPVSMVLTRNGAHLLVVNHLPASPANDRYVASVISVINTKTRQVEHELQLPNGSNGIREICLSPDGRFAYVPHILARYQLPTTQLERGWVNTNAITIMDLDTMSVHATVLLDDIDLGAPNPWGIAISDDGSRMIVTHSGSHELSLIDRNALHQKIKESDRDRLPNTLGFLAGIRERVALPGKGPRGCITLGDRFVIAQYFSDDLAVLSFAPNGKPTPSRLSLGPDIPMTEARRGRFLFNDGSFCFQKWQSCVSCHPSERVDALNWDLLNDGIGTPKNTKSLLYSHQTPPTTVTGCRANAETSVRAGIRFFMAVLPEEDAEAIDTFLKSMRPFPSPRLVNGRLSESAQRGKQVFDKAKCSKCHAGEYFTNMKKYDVGTGRDKEAGTAFDVPTLVEIWRTAPYLHDGRALSIYDVITSENRDDEHGYTQDLSKEELLDLAEYVLSL